MIVVGALRAPTTGTPDRLVGSSGVPLMLFSARLVTLR